MANTLGAFLYDCQPNPRRQPCTARGIARISPQSTQLLLCVIPEAGAGASLCLLGSGTEVVRDIRGATDTAEEFVVGSLYLFMSL